MELLLSNINIVLSNLKLALEHRKAIEELEHSEWMKIPGLQSWNDSECSFYGGIGLCSNLNLWLLDDSQSPEVFSYEGQYENYENVDLMTYFGGKFSDLYGDETTDAESPIIAREFGVKMWEHPLRWKYLTFLIEELEYFQQHGETK